MMQRRVVLLLFLLVAGPAWAAKRALLVGINDYTHAPAEADLRGCVNDVLMTKALLIDKFGFPPENVKVLLDSEATAYNILRSVQEWLITPGAPEDIVYFHFSGHGSQVSDTNHDEEDRRDELICPADMQEGKMSSVITDDQLRVVLGKIPGRNLTVVLDACHSGTGTRDLSLSRPRFVVFDSSLSQTRGLSTASASKAKQKRAGSGGVEGATQSQVTISGCAPEQTSADAWIRDGFYAGALTFFLVENMRKAPPEMNYRELMERVVRDVHARNFSQVPQIEGDMNQALMGGRDVAPVATIPAVTLPSVTAPAVTTPVLTAPVATIPAATAPTVAASPSPATEIECLKVLLEPEAGELRHAVEKALSAYNFIAVMGKDQHFDYRLKFLQRDDQVELALVRDGTPGEPARGADAVAALAALRPQLGNAYSTKCLIALDNLEPPFKVEVWANRGQDPDSLGQTPDEKLVQAKIGDLIRFNFRAGKTCYLTLIDLDANGEVNVLFPNQYQPDGRIQAGKVYRTGLKGEMPFQIRASGPAGREMVKVIASLDSLNIPSLKMGQAGPAGTRRIASGSEFVRQLIRDLTVEGVAAAESMPVTRTDRWSTDYMIIENLPNVP